jgi:formamidopyrimidine-DNA glycosylase
LPELPEVEMVRRGLDDLVAGEKVRDVTVLWPRIIQTPKVDAFKERLLGQTFEKVERRGKFLLFYLTDEVLISHLRMEGKYQLFQPNYMGDLPEWHKHTHVIFHLMSGSELRYNDVRKFGRMSLVKKGTEFEHQSLVNLGPEPTTETFKLAEMQAFLKRRTKAIKGVLLDQQMVVGVGNIYADEILFQAKIHPATPANQVVDEAASRLHQAIIQILDEAVQNGGTTIRSYENAFGDAGQHQQHLKVYGREAEACLECGHEIEKIKLVGRGTHYCPDCQPPADK